MTDTANMEALLASPELSESTDYGVLMAMIWLADGLANDELPLVAMSAFAAIVPEAKRRGLVR